MQVLICCEARHVVQGPGDGPHQDQVRRGAIITFIYIHQTSRRECGDMMVQDGQMEKGDAAKKRQVCHQVRRSRNAVKSGPAILL